ncbi:transmembrane protein 87A [Schistocerca nitens]|uniref:transmembrane protein 87A n=1 Tax=Schistocerca nitens TaxID=7011 RepID=UPI0021186CAA|nr:transmembrane protein 87A [Schistocerca nitens]
MSFSSLFALFVACVVFNVQVIDGFPEQGKWVLNLYDMIEEYHESIPKSLFNGSVATVRVDCSSDSSETDLVLKATMYELHCWSEIFQRGSPEYDDEIIEAQVPADNKTSETRKIFRCMNSRQSFMSEGAVSKALQQGNTKEKTQGDGNGSASKTRKKRSPDSEGGTIAENQDNVDKKPPQKTEPKATSLKLDNQDSVEHDHKIIIAIPRDGMYLLNVVVEKPEKPCNVSIQIDMKGPHGYLSAADWPLLAFYGAMCVVYVLYGIAWLIVSFCQWRDLLRIQFWIGGVILLGMLEKATFYAEYQSINSTGQSVKGAVLMAELVSCAKRMLARMLVIIVSLGFGIVKPRLGPMLHRVVGTGLLYFVLASIESYLRVMHQKNDRSNQVLISGIPLAVLDSIICWWIFTSLVQTTRTLRLRRNLVKLSLYHHFTNTLIFAVGASVIFMLYSIKYHRFTNCLTDWKELWVDDAYWHLLFSIILLVIMVLWRPTNNNQRYAFTPLLDAPEDDDEEDEQFVNDAFGVKMRGNRSNSPKPKSSNSVEDDLKWVEENIPSSVPDTALPILDSDEEIMTTKFEVSKMQ